MKKCILALGLLFAIACHGADGKLFKWEEGKDPETGEKMITFGLSSIDLTRFIEADQRGDSKASDKISSTFPKDLLFIIARLMGDLEIYPSDRVALASMNGDGIIDVSSGFVRINKKKNTVTIALKVLNRGVPQDFMWNGEYPIKRWVKRK
jgi:hypothetical protein